MSPHMQVLLWKDGNNVLSIFTWLIRHVVKVEFIRTDIEIFTRMHLWKRRGKLYDTAKNKIKIIQPSTIIILWIEL